MNLKQIYIVAINGDKTWLYLGAAGLPLSTLEVLVKHKGIVLWNYLGIYNIIGPEVLANAWDNVRDWSQAIVGGKVPPSANLRRISIAQATHVPPDVARVLLQVAQECPEASSSASPSAEGQPQK